MYNRSDRDPQLTHFYAWNASEHTCAWNAYSCTISKNVTCCKHSHRTLLMGGESKYFHLHVVFRKYSIQSFIPKTKPLRDRIAVMERQTIPKVFLILHVPNLFQNSSKSVRKASQIVHKLQLSMLKTLISRSLFSIFKVKIYILDEKLLTECLFYRILYL